MAPPENAAEAKDLMARIAIGDRHAFAVLIDRYGRGIKIYCARALHQPAEAEDASQEVFLRAWSAAVRYDPARGAVSTWLYRIAVNHCIDRNRRIGFWRFLGLSSAGQDQEDPLDAVADDGPGADRALAARQQLARVRREIVALPDRQRQALLLRVIGELDTAAIADALGTGKGAVEQLLVRARATLRQRTGIDLTH